MFIFLLLSHTKNSIIRNLTKTVEEYLKTYLKPLGVFKNIIIYRWISNKP